MKIEALNKKLENIKNGSYVKIKFAKHCDTYKGCEFDITKETECIVRLGVQYSHIEDEALQKRLQEIKLASFEKNESYSEKLPWGQWISKYLIEHKGKYYLRCTISRSPKHRPKTRWFKDGEIVSKDNILDLLTANEKRKNDELVFSLPIDNIIALGKEAK